MGRDIVRRASHPHRSGRRAGGTRRFVGGARRARCAVVARAWPYPMGGAGIFRRVIGQGAGGGFAGAGAVLAGAG